MRPLKYENVPIAVLMDFVTATLSNPAFEIKSGINPFTLSLVVLKPSSNWTNPKVNLINLFWALPQSAIMTFPFGFKTRFNSIRHFSLVSASNWWKTRQSSVGSTSFYARTPDNLPAFDTCPELVDLDIMKKRCQKQPVNSKVLQEREGQTLNNCIMAAKVWNAQPTPTQCNCSISKVADKWQSCLSCLLCFDG